MHFYTMLEQIVTYAVLLQSLVKENEYVAHLKACGKNTLIYRDRTDFDTTIIQAVSISPLQPSTPCFKKLNTLNKPMWVCVCFGIH